MMYVVIISVTLQKVVLNAFVASVSLSKEEYERGGGVRRIVSGFIKEGGLFST